MRGRWEYRCLDRSTGREHRLTVEASNEAEGASTLGRLGFAVSRAMPSPWKNNHRLPEGWEPSIRWVDCELASAGGRWTERNDPSLGPGGDLGPGQLNLRLSPAKRHFLLQGIAEALGGDRDVSNPDLQLAETVCWQWLIECEDLMPSVCLMPGGARLVWNPPRIMVPRRLCIILERHGDHGRLLEAVDLSLRVRLKQTDAMDLEKRRNRAAKKTG